MRDRLSAILAVRVPCRLRSPVVAVALVLLWLTVGLGYDGRVFLGPPTGDRAIKELKKLGPIEDPLGDSVPWVSLSGPGVTDATLDLLVEVEDLTYLALTDTRVTEDGLGRLRRIPGLRDLIIDGMVLTDAGLSRLAGLDGLETLALRDTRITGSGLGALKSLPSLHALTIEGPLATVDGLAGLKDLKELRLVNTRLTDRDLGSLKNLPGLETFEIGDSTQRLRSLGFLNEMSRLRCLGCWINCSQTELQEYMRRHPNVQFERGRCGFGQVDRPTELADRHVRNQGLTGHLRLAWSRHFRH
jgi:hypothetical protein